MVVGLNAVAPRRRLAAVALVLIVTGVHGCMAERWAEHAIEFLRCETLPPRLQVAYVRQMALAAPPAVAPAPVPKPRPRRRALPMAPAASAPSEVAPAVPSAPAEPVAPVAETPPPAPAASAPPEPVVAAASAASSPDAATPFEWPGSTRLRYGLSGYYRGEVYGQAQVEWVHVGSHYQVHLDVTVGPSFAPLGSRQMSSDGEITPEGLSPQRYDQITRLAFQDAHHSVVLFDPDSVLLSTGQRRERWPGLQDTASQFVQFSYLFATHPETLHSGNTVVMPLAMPRTLSDWVYDVNDEELVYTPFGAVTAFPLKPRRIAQAGGDLTTEIWIAPQLRYLPVRFRIRQDAETYFDLMLDRLPDLAAPSTP